MVSRDLLDPDVAEGIHAAVILQNQQILRYLQELHGGRISVEKASSLYVPFSRRASLRDRQHLPSPILSENVVVTSGCPLSNHYCRDFQI